MHFIIKFKYTYTYTQLSFLCLCRKRTWRGLARTQSFERTIFAVKVMRRANTKICIYIYVCGLVFVFAYSNSSYHFVVAFHPAIGFFFDSILNSIQLLLFVCVSELFVRFVLFFAKIQIIRFEQMIYNLVQKTTPHGHKRYTLLSS